MAKFIKKPVVVDAVRWNVPQPAVMPDGKTQFLKPDLARKCKDSNLVRCTSYMEVAELLDTSGCSRNEPYWNWEVLGIVNTPSGPAVVCPGDWIITNELGESYPCSNEVFEKMHSPIKTYQYKGNDYAVHGEQLIKWSDGTWKPAMLYSRVAALGLDGMYGRLKDDFESKFEELK